MSNICIEAQNLKIQFPLKHKMFQERKYLKAVDGVSFAIEQGTTMGLGRERLRQDHGGAGIAAAL